MDDLENKSIRELADRLNQIMVERDKLYIEYSQILEELYKRLPNLKDNKSLKLQKIKEFQEVNMLIAYLSLVILTLFIVLAMCKVGSDFDNKE